MPRGHSRGHHRGKHSLEPTRSASFHTIFHRRRMVLVTAPLVTALAVGTGVATSGFKAPTAPSQAAGSISAAGATSSTSDNERTTGTTRSADRVPLVDHRVPKPKGKLWTTADLDLRIEPREKSRTDGQLDAGKRVSITGRKMGAYAEVLIGRQTRWVTADYLSKEKEQQPGSLGLVDRPCPGTDEVESGLTDSAVRVYRAVCNNFPEVTSYGGYAPRGEHADGRAIDIMTPDPGLGDRIAEFLQANAAALDLYDVLWAQRIWTPERAAEGWRSMEDRGSATANHMDHVHVKAN